MAEMQDDGSGGKTKDGTVEVSKRNAPTRCREAAWPPTPVVRCAAHSRVEIGTVLGLSPFGAKLGYALWAQRGASA